MDGAAHNPSIFSEFINTILYFLQFFMNSLFSKSKIAMIKDELFTIDKNDR